MMLGVASPPVERSSGDPLANLERLIQENSEVQAGNFQLQHEMRAALAERNTMLRDLCEVVNKEKELVETLSDRCKKVEQHRTVIEWISQTLQQITKDRADKKCRMSEVECTIAEHGALIENLKRQFSDLQVELKEIQSERDLIRADISAVQPKIIKDILSLEELQTKGKEYNAEFSELLTIAEEKYSEFSSLQQAASNAFVEIFSSRLSLNKQIEDLELESETLTQLDTEFDARRNRLDEIKAEIIRFRKLIQRHDELEKELLRTEISMEDFCKSLETSNDLMRSAVNERQILIYRLLELTEEENGLEKRFCSSQAYMRQSRESLNGSDKTMEMYEAQVDNIMQEIAQCEYNRQELSEKLVSVRNQNRDLLEQRSKTELDLKDSIYSSLEQQLRLVQKLKQYNDHCKNILSNLHFSNQWDQLRQDLIDLAIICPSVSDNENEESVTQYDQIINEMCAESYLFTNQIEELDYELNEISSNFDQLSEEYHHNVNEFKSSIKEKNKLTLQLANLQTELGQSKMHFAQMINERAAFYQKRIEEEQTSDIRDLSSIPKEILEELNNTKQQQARNFNKRMIEIQAQIDAAANNKNQKKTVPNSKQRKGCSSTNTKKLLPRKTACDPWMLE